MTVRIISENPEVQAHYEECLRKGCAERLAEMLALGKSPYTHTNAEFFKGHCNGSEFAADPATGDKYRKIAEANGVSTTGKKYMSQLADSPGDPRAWVNDKADVKRLAEERNLEIEGVITHKQREVEPRKPAAVAENLVREKMLEEVVKNPERKNDLQNLREEVKERLTPSWKKP